MQANSKRILIAFWNLQNTCLSTPPNARLYTQKNCLYNI